MRVFNTGLATNQPLLRPWGMHEARDIYTVDTAYVDTLSQEAPHLFHNSKPSQGHSKKYIGVLLKVGDMDYFAPLSSFKPKHRQMKNSLDFLKVGDYAVVNLNCMFPVPSGAYSRVDIPKERDARYRDLMTAELRVIRRMEGRIMHNAAVLYRYKIANGDSTKLAKRCNDFRLLEAICERWHSSSTKEMTPPV